MTHPDGRAATAPLADDLFRIGHNDVTGKPRLHSHGLGVGLAGALLAELTLAGHVTVHNGLLHVVDGRPPRDAPAHTVLDQLIGEAQVRQAAHGWRSWHATPRTWWRSGWSGPGTWDRYRPVDAVRAAPAPFASRRI